MYPQAAVLSERCPWTWRYPTAVSRSVSIFSDSFIECFVGDFFSLKRFDLVKIVKKKSFFLFEYSFGRPVARQTDIRVAPVSTA